jgi:hypothetical protein
MGHRAGFHLHFLNNGRCNEQAETFAMPHHSALSQVTKPCLSPPYIFSSHLEQRPSFPKIASKPSFPAQSQYSLQRTNIGTFNTLQHQHTSLGRAVTHLARRDSIMDFISSLLTQFLQLPIPIIIIARSPTRHDRGLWSNIKTNFQQGLNDLHRARHRPFSITTINIT